MQGVKRKRVTITFDLDIGEDYVSPVDAAFFLRIAYRQIEKYVTIVDRMPVVTFEDLKKAAREQIGLSEGQIIFLMSKLKPASDEDFEHKMAKLVEEFGKELENRLSGRENDRIRHELKEELRKKKK